MRVGLITNISYEYFVDKSFIDYENLEYFAIQIEVPQTTWCWSQHYFDSIMDVINTKTVLAIVIPLDLSLVFINKGDKATREDKYY